MADLDYDEPLELDDAEFGEEDNAKALTGGLVIATFLVGLLAIIVMLMAEGRWFDMGPFKSGG